MRTGLVSSGHTCGYMFALLHMVDMRVVRLALCGGDVVRTSRRQKVVLQRQRQLQRRRPNQKPTEIDNMSVWEAENMCLGTARAILVFVHAVYWNAHVVGSMLLLALHPRVHL